MMLARIATQWHPASSSMARSLASMASTRHFAASATAAATASNVNANTPNTANASTNANQTGKNSINRPTLAALAITSLTSLLGGYCLGTSHSKEYEELQRNRVLPSGELRGCCSCDSGGSGDAGTEGAKTSKTSEGSGGGGGSDSGGSGVELTEAQSALPEKLAKLVGPTHVISGLYGNGGSGGSGGKRSGGKPTSQTAKFLKGARLGQGEALCIVQPGSLKEAVRVLKEVVDAGCVVVPQGSNTGLTGGSVPRNDTEDTRPCVIISMKRLDAHFPIDSGNRVVCLAGVGISTLSTSISTWFPNRQSHSILGSTFLNPTTAAGVAFGSGGVYLRKGPACTDRALFCRIRRDKWGENQVDLVNTLGVEGLEDEDFLYSHANGEENALDETLGAKKTALGALGELDAYAADVKRGFKRVMAKSSESKHGKAEAHDADYHETVCEDTPSVSRYNADTMGEDCNRSEGKVLILATVHDTFPKPSKSKVFWVTFPDLETALQFRREVCLNNPNDLPVSCEYLDRDSVDIIDRSGRILCYMIRFIGMGDLMGLLWQVKLKIEGLPFSWAPLICDQLLHTFNNVVPTAIPDKFITAGKESDHNVIVSVGEFGDGTMDRFIERMEAFSKKHNDKHQANVVKAVECTSNSEVDALNAFRFVAAVAFRTYCVGENIQGVSVDYALPKNGGRVPPLPEGAATPVKRMRYSHFGCNVVHEDLAYALGVDTHEEKMAYKKSVEREGGKLPAEHGHGTEYHAPEDAQERWKRMDPLNVLNPGVGGLSYLPKYGK